MSTPSQSTQRAYARLTGYLYLANYLFAVTGTLVPASLRGTGTYAEKAARAVTARHAYGAALASSTVAWLLIIILAYALYVTLAPVHKRLAQIALLLQLGHAWMGFITVTFGFLVMKLYVMPHPAPLIRNETEYVISVLNSATGNAFNIAMIFVGCASALNFHLFIRSKYIPKILAIFGLFASAVLILVSLGQLIYPEFAAQWQYGWGPMGLAEVGTALWLVFGGIRLAPAPLNQGAAISTGGSVPSPIFQPNE